MSFFIDDVRFAKIMRTFRHSVFIFDSEMPTIDEFTEFLCMGFTGSATLPPAYMQSWESAIPEDSWWPHIFNHEKYELFGCKLGSLLHNVQIAENNFFEINFDINSLKTMAREWRLPFKYSQESGLQFYNSEEYYQLIWAESNSDLYS